MFAPPRGSAAALVLVVACGPAHRCPPPTVTETVVAVSDIHPEGAYHVLTLASKKKGDVLDAVFDPWGAVVDAAKNEVNALRFDIAVDPDVWRSAVVGEPLAERFAWGSMLLGGSMGEIQIVVEAKKLAPRSGGEAESFEAPE